MNPLKSLPFLIICALFLSCGEEAKENASVETMDSISARNVDAQVDTPSGSLKEDASTTPSKSNSRKLTKAELERIIDDLGFQLEEMKGREAELQTSLKKLSKKKLSESEKTEQANLEKSLSELRAKIAKTLDKLSRKQKELQGS